MDPPWPPKSPHDALLSSPSGRKRYQNALSNRLAPTSPTKRSATTPNLTQLGQSQDDSEDDEETLQLKLQAIEAKLKLKKLQQQKARATTSDVENEAESRPSSVADSVRSRPPSRYVEERERVISRAGSRQSQVQVPLSPTKRQIPVASKSPGRVLGKDRNAADVSLGRVPSLRKRSKHEDPFTSTPDVQPSQYRSLRSTNQVPELNPSLEQRMSFSERIAQSRSHEKDRQGRIEERQRNRSSGFQLDQSKLDLYKSAAEGPRHPVLSGTPAKSADGTRFSRDEVLRGFNKPSDQPIRRSNTTGRITDRRNDDSSSSAVRSGLTVKDDRNLNTTRPPSSSAIHQSSYFSRTLPLEEEEEVSHHAPPTSSADPSLFEPFSSLHLSKRILPHTFLTRTLTSKTPFCVPDLLRTIKHPTYDPPDCDNFVVLGIIASKSLPKEQKTSGHSHKSHQDTSARSPKRNDDANAKNKYIALTLTDLKYSIDLFLFSTAFNRYYKLTPGTVIAILNPNILPPPPHKRDTHIFSLSLSSDEDTVLEIGTAKDLGFCKSARKDGKICDAWLDARHTEFCDFHIDRQVSKAKSGRMEVNTGISLFGPGGRRRGGGGGSNWEGIKSGRDRFNDQRGQHTVVNTDNKGGKYDRSTGTSYFITPSMPSSRTATRTTNHDADDFPDTLDDTFLPTSTRDKQDRLRRHLADLEREREISRKLGASAAGGMGAQYMKLRHEKADEEAEARANPGAARAAPKVDVPGMGEGKRKAMDMRLSPVKKTRFVTSRGIREAGRESLGVGRAGEMEGQAEDDGLDIV